MKPHKTHLEPQAVNNAVVLAVVHPLGGACLLHELKDLGLQLAIGLLQGLHRLQIVGQTVIKMLHGGLLVANSERPRGGSQGTVVVAPGAAELSTGGGGAGDPDPVAPGSSEHAVSVWPVDLQPTGGWTNSHTMATVSLHEGLHQRS